MITCRQFVILRLGAESEAHTIGSVFISGFKTFAAGGVWVL